MKQITFLLFFLFISLTYISGQTTYQKFVVEGSHWQVNYSYCDVFAGCDPGNGPSIFHYDYYYYKLEGDTLIDAVKYKKLWLSTLTTCPDCRPPYTAPESPTCTPYYVTAYLTEDTAGQKVYFKSNNQNQCGTDSLFLDFSLSVGDSIYLSYVTSGNFVNCDTNKFIVDSINYKGFNNNGAKTLYLRNSDPYLNPSGGAMLYQGIGYSFGFDLLYDLGDGADYGSVLTKFCSGSDTTCWTICYPAGIDNLLPGNIDIAIQPNPAQDLVEVKSDLANIKEVQVYDSGGRLLLASSSDHFTVSSLAPAVYFLIIKTDKGLVYKRIVKL